ncbi:Uncharacterised protein [Bordetella pertussis]|nr:Uncharacterised protein [Bordetella pertussis]
MQALAARADSPPVRAWVGALAHADAQGTCIFPCTFIVLAFPIGYALLQGGP